VTGSGDQLMLNPAENRRVPRDPIARSRRVFNGIPRHSVTAAVCVPRARELESLVHE